MSMLTRRAVHISRCPDITSLFSYKYHWGHFYSRHHRGSKHSPLCLSLELQQRGKGIQSGQELNTTPRHLLVTSLSANNCFWFFFPERLPHIKTHETHQEPALLRWTAAPELLSGVLFRKRDTSIHAGDGENIWFCSRRRGPIRQHLPSSKIPGKRHQPHHHLRPMETDAPLQRSQVSS